MGRNPHRLLLSAVAILLFHAPAGIAQTKKVTKQDVLIVFSSHDVKDKFDACAGAYPAPPEIKFTIIIDQKGLASLGGTEPAISGLLKACFLNILSDLRFKATGARFEIVYSMKLHPPAAPAVEESPPGLEPLSQGVLMQYDNSPLWIKSRQAIIAGLVLSAIGSTAFISGLGVAWSGIEPGGDLHYTGIMISLNFVPFIMGSELISLIGLSAKSIVLRRMGIRFSPAGTVLGWFTTASGFLLSLIMGPISILSHKATADCEPGADCSSGHVGVLETGLFTVGGALLIASLVSQAIQLSYLEKKPKGGASTAASFVPLLSYGYSAQGGAHTLALIWTL